jgi:hypothetical protein
MVSSSLYSPKITGKVREESLFHEIKGEVREESLFHEIKGGVREESLCDSERDILTWARYWTAVTVDSEPNPLTPFPVKEGGTENGGGASGIFRKITRGVREAQGFSGWATAK